MTTPPDEIWLKHDGYSVLQGCEHEPGTVRYVRSDGPSCEEVALAMEAGFGVKQKYNHWCVTKDVAKEIVHQSTVAEAIAAMVEAWKASKEQKP